MSRQSTWADGFITCIQAIADQLNLRVFIVKSYTGLQSV